MKSGFTKFLVLLLLAMSPSVMFAANASLDKLLEAVKQGGVQEQKENKAREARFKAAQNKQAALLKKTRAEFQQETKRSSKLEAEFEANEAVLSKKTEALNERLGSLKELFGVLQQVAGDTRGVFENSVISAQFPDREAFLTQLAKKMGQTSQLASIEEIEQLWFEMQQEMTQSAKVVRFDAAVVAPNGETVQRQVVRVGAFNLVADGKYLARIPETGKIVELARQPSHRVLKTAAQLQSSQSGLTNFGLDPSRGQILSLLVEKPNLRERIEQGGVVGYIILALGALSLLVASERLLSLWWVSLKMKVQMGKPEPSNNNPLGRVMQVYANNPKADIDTLELKLGEAILKEVPKLNRRANFIKVTAVIAPLLGLLGTVAGMINTFQAITLFGTGDPKLMAGGISQALVTTVLGLVVAIPAVLMHSLVHNRYRSLVHVLEHQSAGIIAEHAERGQHDKAA